MITKTKNPPPYDRMRPEKKLEGFPKMQKAE